MLVIAIPNFLPILQKKEISIHLSKTTSLINSNQKNLALIYNGKKLDKAYVTDIKFSNTGNQPLMKQDFQENFEIISDGQNSFISIFIKDSYPIKNSINMEVLEKKSVIEPFLLNKREFMVFQVITEGYSFQDFEFLTRFSGFKVKVISEKDDSLDFESMIHLLLLFLFSSIYSLLYHIHNDLQFNEKMYIFLIVLLAIIIISYMFLLYFIIDSVWNSLLIPIAYLLPIVISIVYKLLKK